MASMHTRIGLSRDDVIDAALQMVQAEGSEALTMRKLADRMGVTTPTIYWHVGGRDEVLVAALDRFASRHQPHATGGRTPRERIIGLLRQMFDGGLEHPHLVRLSTEHIGVEHLARPWERAVANEVIAAGLAGRGAAAALHALLATVGGLIHAELRRAASSGATLGPVQGEDSPELEALRSVRPSAGEIFDLVVPPLVTSLIPGRARRGR